ncbi:hypothetical protein BDN70DRAFT_490016 [Pholiota conissans]|uniref:Uncharacterized protein n=1 Tax=Pholiota conissans TaxID=109636 RepID=A0A9P5YM29_9AGAR|nr:hypothetical protein BDN70DRAFT_490016 [Pholiota conissans]
MEAGFLLVVGPVSMTSVSCSFIFVVFRFIPISPGAIGFSRAAIETGPLRTRPLASGDLVADELRNV